LTITIAIVQQNLLPEPVIEKEEEKKEEGKSQAGDFMKSMGLGGLLGMGAKEKQK
jgi:hypothetical protein